MQTNRLRFAYLLAGVLTVSACSADGTNSETENGETELSFWVYGANYEALIEEYEREHGDISIDLVRRDKDDHQLGLFTALSAGSGAPDIAALDWNELETYLDARHQFVDLRTFGADEKADDFLDWAFQAGTPSDSDSLIGLPTTVSPTVMHYNADLFSEAGLPSDPEEVEQALQSWAQFEDAALQLLEETGSAMAGNPDVIYHAKRDQLEKAYFNEEGELLIGSEPYIESIFMDTADLMDEDVILLHDRDSDSWREALRNEAFAVILGDRKMSDNLTEDAPDMNNWRMAQIPEGAGNHGGTWLSIPEQSNHAEEAYRFIEWLTSPEQLLRMYEEEGQFPPAPAVYEDERFSVVTDPYFGGQATGPVFAEAAINANLHYRGRNYNSVDEEILIGLDDVYLGASPEEEWAAILERVNRRIER